MTLAANLPDADRVCVTETRAGGALTWLRRNVARNEDGEVVLWRPGVVHVEACDWTAYGDEHRDDTAGDESTRSSDDDDDTAGDESTRSTPRSAGVNPRLEATEWDVIVGSDLVYDDDGVRYLPRAVRHFLRKRRTHFLYAHTKYRYELRDMALWREFHECGLDVEEVREDGAPSPPSSPEPLTQLFPEKRIAVLRITLREEDE